MTNFITLNDMYGTLKSNLQDQVNRLGIRSKSYKIELNDLHPYSTIKCILKDSQAKIEDISSEMVRSITLTIDEVINLPLQNDYSRYIFMSALNSIYRDLDQIVYDHCDSLMAQKCAESLKSMIGDRKKVLFIGVEEKLFCNFVDKDNIRTIDFSSKHVWEECSGIVVEHGSKVIDAITWCDIILITENTLLNEKIIPLINQRKPVVFLGSSFVFAARSLGFQHYCLAGLS